MDFKKCRIGDSDDDNSQISSVGCGKTDSSKQLKINDENFVFKLFLPSFEMHNNMLNQTLLDTEYIRGAKRSDPPTYDEQTNQSDATVPPDHVSPEARMARFGDLTNSPEMLVLNNLNTFPTLELPIKLNIVLTKTLPTGNGYSERETPLKVYKPGDIVTGYTLVENLSKDPIPFEMFLVSLEGTVTTESARNKLTRNCFLRMYDLCASHHYGVLDVSPTANLCDPIRVIGYSM
ncbi:unnamed protein product [Ambrosiozyma monospora]|uniref:Unnamed protein product n=1 Tax=Ambrosiozyma monospora TaxID=43982 RepID=A0ACB5TH69_AMBMO|nr:unnamed protein product [Ambrosiozyma monospora]